MPTTKLVVDVVLLGESPMAFNIVRQLDFRLALAAALEVSAADIVIARTATFHPPRAQRRLAAAASVVVECFVLTDSSQARRLAQRLGATGFVTLFTATLQQHGLTGVRASVGKPAISAIGSAAVAAETMPSPAPARARAAAAAALSPASAAAAGGGGGGGGSVQTQLIMLAVVASAALTAIGWGSFLIVQRLRTASAAGAAAARRGGARSSREEQHALNANADQPQQELVSSGVTSAPSRDAAPTYQT